MLTDTRNKHFSERVYYASGVPMARSFGRDVQPYLYNGKEFIEAHGLNEYDSQARMYYAPIMRTITMDPLAEKYYHISPYAWCGNNPVNRVDPDGCDVHPADSAAYNTILNTLHPADRQYVILDKNGKSTQSA